MAHADPLVRNLEIGANENYRRTGPRDWTKNRVRTAQLKQASMVVL